VKVVVVGLVLGSLGVFVAGTVSTHAANPTQTVAATADAYVSAAKPSANFGTSASLRIDAAPLQRAYLRFTVAGLSGQVTKATLRLYATSASRAGLTVQGVADTTWAETTITAANAPTPAAPTTPRSAAFGTGWVAVDVTGLVAGNGVISLAIANPSSTATGFRSREAGASSAPQLVIETQAAPPPVTTAPANQTVPTISGTAQEKQALTADPGGWSGQPTFAYHW
jgi:hypothetical protein